MIARLGRDNDQKDGLFTIVMALATFVVVIDNTIMNVSINALVRDLNTTISGVQAAISLNALTMAAFVLMGGKLADILGIKKTFLLGSLTYIAGTVIARSARTWRRSCWAGVLFRASAPPSCCRMCRPRSVSTSAAKLELNRTGSWAG